MKLTTKLRDVKHHIDVWLTLWQGGIDITTREKDVLAEFIAIHLLLVSKGMKEPYLAKLLFDADARKQVCINLSISSFNLTNVLAALKNKGAITDNVISSQLIPEKELIFEFK